METVRPARSTDSEIYAYTGDWRAGAFFFLPKPEHRDVVELAEAAGVVAIGFDRWPGRTTRDLPAGTWSPIEGVVLRRREYSEHIALEVFFSQNAFDRLYDGIPTRKELSLEEDPALPVAHAFRDACLRLNPDVALFTLDNYVADTDNQEKEIYPLVRGNDDEGLAHEGGLLYLNERRKYGLYGLELLDERDQIPIDRGMLLFARRGRSRWA